jgi:hypothetical protein
MTITRNDVVRLLALAAGGDQRTVAAEDVTLWHGIAATQGWTAAAAQRVIIEHYSRGADRPRITPAAITDRLLVLRNHAAESFEAPRVPLDLPDAQYPVWLRAQLTAHVDAQLHRWATTGQEPDRAVTADSGPVRDVAQLVAAAPERLRPAMAAAAKRITRRRPQLDPDRRAAARAELDARRGAS